MSQDGYPNEALASALTDLDNPIPDQDSLDLAAERLRAFEKLCQEVEEQWPNLRVPSRVGRNPAPAVGARLRRAVEAARAR